MNAITQATPITDYKMLTPLPNTLTGGQKINDLQGYVPNLFNIIIGLAAVLAVGWIIWGGIEYITTDSWQNKQEGKRRIFNAIWGLLIVIGAWLILYTINPKLLNFDLNIKTTQVTAPGVATGACADCVSLAGSGLKFGNNTNTTISSQISSGLISLNSDLQSQGITLTITEAYPPTGQHIDSCHTNGTCVDATIPGLNSITATEAANIIKVYNDAKASGFSTAIFEVTTQAQVDAWAQLGVKAYTYPSTTGSSFHFAK